MENKELILEFLNTPLEDGSLIIERFSALPGAVSGVGSMPLQRYVYILGTRQDRVVLVAHADTVWDSHYKDRFKGECEPRGIIFEDGKFTSSSDKCGIGADDRAGCAMLWKLKDCGHSILVVDGEEFGKRGARFLKRSNRKLYKELNRHCFMIELDQKRTNCVSFAQVYNTKKFKAFFENETGFENKNLTGGCDLQVLCSKVCGANVGVGYARYHTAKEVLILSEWENTYDKISEFLSKPQKRYKIPARTRLLVFIKRCKDKGLRILKIKK